MTHSTELQLDGLADGSPRSEAAEADQDRVRAKFPREASNTKGGFRIKDPCKCFNMLACDTLLSNDCTIASVDVCASMSSSRARPAVRYYTSFKWWFVSPYMGPG